MLQSRDKKSNINATRGDNSKSKKATFVILVCDMSSGHVLHFYQVSSKYSKGCFTYIAVTKSKHNHCQIKQREILPKVKKKAELLFFYATRHLILFFISTKYHQNILKGSRVTQLTLNQFQKQNKGR